MYKKRVSILVLLVALLTITVIPSKAMEETGVLISKIPASIEELAQINYKKHLYSLILAEELPGQIQDYVLGPSLEYKNDPNYQYKTYIFPILRKSDVGNEVVGTFHVTLDSEDITYNMFTSTADILKPYLEASSDVFILVPDKRGFKIECVGDAEYKMLRNTYGAMNNKLINSIILDRLGEKSSSRYEGPEEEKILNVRSVLQDGPTCWAATCAANINYLKNKDLTYYDVASYINPNNPNSGGSERDQIDAYKHWGIDAYARGILRYQDIKSNINAYIPIHARLRDFEAVGNDRHAVSIIGYTKWNWGGTEDIVLTIREPNTRNLVTVSLLPGDNGFNYYYFNSGPMYWYRTLELYP